MLSYLQFCLYIWSSLPNIQKASPIVMDIRGTPFVCNMQQSMLSSTSSRILLLFLLFLTASTATVAFDSLTSACKSSFYPELCRSILTPLDPASNCYDYGLSSVKQALMQVKRTTKIIDRYLSKELNGGCKTVIGALDDCLQLADLNVDYLKAVEKELGLGDMALGHSKIDRVKALMSALVTNRHTCYDGLKAASSFPEMYETFLNESKLYGVSLELVTSALDQTNARPDESPKPISDFHGLPIEHKLSKGDVSVIPMSRSVTVSQDGRGNFTTITEAVNFAPNNTSIEKGHFVIFIRPGVYRETITVSKKKKNLIMIGAGVDRTVITGNRNVKDGWTTYNSSTFAVHGERFIAMNITFENTAGPEKHQAVAVRNSADFSSFYLCKFVGYQDTLYVHSLRQFYRDCEIYGTVDFIFGNAAAVFQNCKILSRRPLPHQFNTITAQGRSHPNQTTGISIHNCSILAAPDLESSTKTYLGRPWKEYSRTVYIQSFMDSLIDPAGWTIWNKNDSFALDTLFYGEFENEGPGAKTNQRVRWPGFNLMNATQASNFTVSNFIDGRVWLPPSISYSAGLVN